MLQLVFIRNVAFLFLILPKSLSLEDWDLMDIQGHAIQDFLVDFK